MSIGSYVILALALRSVVQALAQGENNPNGSRFPWGILLKFALLRPLNMTLVFRLRKP